MSDPGSVDQKSPNGKWTLSGWGKKFHLASIFRDCIIAWTPAWSIDHENIAHRYLYERIRENLTRVELRVDGKMFDRVEALATNTGAGGKVTSAGRFKISNMISKKRKW